MKRAAGPAKMLHIARESVLVDVVCGIQKKTLHMRSRMSQNEIDEKR